MLILDAMRAEFARFLADDPQGRWRMDKALAHVLTMAYQRGLDDGRRGEGSAAHLENLARDLLDPERYGFAVTEEIRDAARHALGIAPINAAGNSSTVSGGFGSRTPAGGARKLHIKIGGAAS